MKGTLGALNATLGPTGSGGVVIGNSRYVGVQIPAGTLVGTIQLQVTTDNGSTWDPVENGTWSSFPITRVVDRISRHNQFRLKVTAYTSGTTDGNLENVDDM